MRKILKFPQIFENFQKIPEIFQKISKLQKITLNTRGHGSERNFSLVLHDMGEKSTFFP